MSTSAPDAAHRQCNLAEVVVNASIRILVCSIEQPPSVVAFWVDEAYSRILRKETLQHIAKAIESDHCVRFGVDEAWVLRQLVVRRAINDDLP